MGLFGDDGPGSPLWTFLRSFCLSAAAVLGSGLLVNHAVPGLLGATLPSSVVPSRSLDVGTGKSLSRRQVGAVALSTAVVAWRPGPAAAEAKPLAKLAEAETVPVWFGNGCFWGRQHDFALLEKSAFKRDDAMVTSLVGYAGGTKAGPGGLNCYFGGPLGSLYELNGQAEVVQLELNKGNFEEQFRAATRVFFRQFNRLPTGQMIRTDPQDIGPAYRNVLGIPGGINSPLMSIVRQENVNQMQLREGRGNDGDALNVVWVMDTAKFPFYRAERYHQFHRGLGNKDFGPEYLEGLKQAQVQAGRIDPTGCPES